MLSYRISAIGLEPELVRNYPKAEEFESPFLRQNVELNDYVDTYDNWLSGHSPVRKDSSQIDVLFTQCEEIVGKIRRASAVHGISVSLTRLLLRLPTVLPHALIKEKTSRTWGILSSGCECYAR